MIKLTVHPDSNPTTHEFQKKTVVIGTKGDLALDEEILQDTHVLIEESENFFIIINTAQDPYATVNFLPFGKKILRDGDLLEIGKTPISINIVHTSKNVPNSDDKLQEVLEHAIASTGELPATGGMRQASYADIPDELDLDIEAELEHAESLAEDAKQVDEILDEDLESLDIDSLLNRVKVENNIPKPAEYSNGNELNFLEEFNKKIDFVKQKKGSLKDFYLSHLDDEQNPAAEELDEQPDSKTAWNWKLIWGMISGLIILLILAFTLIYLNVSGKYIEEELKAAEGVADISMALTYAQTHHLKPQNQNWSNPEFIKTNLLAVLAAEYPPAGFMDIQGQLTNTPYHIRIYTSSDLTHFLVIAQPSPGILQWLIPRASIVVDSKQMELRKVNDLKSLNRILSSLNTLDGSNALEVSNLVKEGELIPLAYLAAKAQKQGFSLPSALTLIRPGTENYIYNAPRYYRFGETFLQKPLMIADSQGNNHEIELLQQEMKTILKYPGIVLYSSQGLQWAINSQKALNTFLPNNRVLVGYLQFNSKGLVSGSKLLMDEGESDASYEASLANMQNLRPELIAEGEDENPTFSAGSESNHPVEVSSENNYEEKAILMKLCAIKSAYLQKLYPLQAEWAELINTPHKDDIIALFGRLEDLLKKSEKTYADDPAKQEKTSTALQFVKILKEVLRNHGQRYKEIEEELLHQIATLQKDHSSLSFEEFLNNLQMAGFNPSLFEHSLENNEAHTQSDINEANLSNLIDSINKVRTLKDLNDHVAEIASLLSIDKTNSKKLVAYQSKTRLEVLQKLNDFLLSKEKGLSDEEFNAENQSHLSHILKNSWIADQDELNFYINEFEVRMYQKN